jgi:hypothetical protein
MTITIGLQGPARSGNISTLKVDLCRLFDERCQDTYCSAIDEFAPILRVNSDDAEFGPEAIERLERAARYVSVDIVVPSERWRTLATSELKEYLACQVRAALKLCVARLKDDGEEILEDQFFQDVDSAIARFLAIQHKPNPDLRATCPNCGTELRSANAKQCFECGYSWRRNGNCERL